ncbi:alanyl-tRNA editing protein [Sharpea azabuensis]|uniref:Alanyl-tRNA synthetase n=1 Tax=Sharpea azabuensis TaxID=322505 RepID=A0A1H6XRM8_9FIRM|nr:alanine--tRNA ligase-related protein [Sharpea azabuensis]SEJ31699.1 alanyl-tRNA synthetase [Sharpea azabuensis]
METVKLYDEHPYDTTFHATIQDIQYDKNTTLILDQTLFFPEEGGQCADSGTIDGYEVIDVQISKGIIKHILKGHVELEIGNEIQGEIDWNLRFSNMQNHSGEHIFSGIVHREYGYDNVGFHLGKDVVSVDFNGPIDEVSLRRIEKEVNQVIYENRVIRAYYPSEEELASLNYRSKKEVDSPLRIVEIENCDVCACCAPHVRRSGEVGLFKVVHMMNYKGGVRIFILCGQRALDYVLELDDNMNAIYHMLSANNSSVVKYVKQLIDTNNALKQEVFNLNKKEVQRLVEEANENHRYFFIEDLDKNLQREMVNSLVQRLEGYVGVFVGSDQMGYRFILASRNNDTTKLFDVLKSHGAKGGGNALMVQGYMKTSQDTIEELLKSQQ